MTEPRRASWRAIGTSVHVLVLEGDPDRACAAVAAAVDEADRAYSRFRPDSELRRLMARAGEPTVVSPALARALESALRVARLTDGAVDPTIGRAIRLLGYDADFAALGDPVRVTAPPTLTIEPVPGWRAIGWEPRTSTVRLPAGVELDLGSTGKALIADLAAPAALDAAGARGVLVSLGGDVATAGEAPDGGWRILMAEDADTPPDADGEVVAIHDGALATSSTTVRRWRRGTIERHHLLDPATGLPADGPWRTASVVAATCVDANAAATAAIVTGEAAPAWLQAVGLPGRLVATDGTVVRVAGWPEPDADDHPDPVPDPDPRARNPFDRRLAETPDVSDPAGIARGAVSA